MLLTFILRGNFPKSFVLEHILDKGYKPKSFRFVKMPLPKDFLIGNARKFLSNFFNNALIYKIYKIYLLIWMFCSITFINKLNNIYEKYLRLITKDYDSNFNELLFNKLLESCHGLSIHKACINHLMIEIYKYLRRLSPELMTGIWALRKIPYNIRSIHLFGS